MWNVTAANWDFWDNVFYLRLQCVASGTWKEAGVPEKLKSSSNLILSYLNLNSSHGQGPSYWVDDAYES